MPSATDTAPDPFTIVNGHEVAIPACRGRGAPADASQTDYIIVKFDTFVDFEMKVRLAAEEKLQILEHLGDNAYLCKYEPHDLTAVNNVDAITHVTLYPQDVVPRADILTNTQDAASVAPSSVTPDNDAIPFVIEMHPSATQTPQQVLEEMQRQFPSVEHMDDEIVGNTIRVKMDPSVIPQIAAVDSIRTIANYDQPQLFSIRQRAICQFSTKAGSASSAYRGEGEIVYIADTGFDRGVIDDVHPAFTGRVLAAVPSNGATTTVDTNAHGTHVAGSILANYLVDGGADDMKNAQGTAPEAKLISISLNFEAFPQTQALLTQNVAPYGPPLVMNNSWGAGWNRNNPISWYQRGYGPADAAIVDQVMFDNPQACLVFAAGNDGELVGRNGNQQQIGAYSASKNCITVGATLSDRPLDVAGFAYQAGGTIHSTHEMTTFSSLGPTAEGRLAPDVVAPGAVILSTRSRAISPENLASCIRSYGQPTSDQLLFMEGTSQATPAVTGCVAVLRSAFRQQQGQTLPTGALLKALLIHGAIDMVGTPFTVVSRTYTGGKTKAKYTMTAAPNNFQGYGIVDIESSLAPIIGPVSQQRGFLSTSILTSSRTQSVQKITIPPNAKRLTVTLAYTDRPGESLQDRVSLSVRLSDNSVLQPLTPTDPLNRNFTYTQSNVAKIVALSPTSGPAEVLLDIQSLSRQVAFALVWTVE